jgi:hypothetical protein
VARIASLSSENIVGSAIPRLIIWEATWLMGSENPWMGSGLGTFAHQYLEFQHPNDGLRYFAHNDYLQSWQEGGVIRVLLLLGMVGWTAMSWLRAITNRKISGERMIEVSGITLGLGAVLVHTTLTFNLYIPAILIGCGIYLARLQQLNSENLALTNIESAQLNLHKYLRPSLFKLVILLLMLAPALFLGKIALSDWHEMEALQAIKERAWIKADYHYASANEVWDGYELRLVQRAKIRRMIIHKMRRELRDLDILSKRRELPVLERLGAIEPVTKLPLSKISPLGDLSMQRQLFAEAVVFLDNPRVVNSALGDGWLERAKLYSELSDLTEGSVDATVSIKSSFGKALHHWPNHLKLRRRYIDYLIKQNDSTTAWKVLVGGWSNPKYPGVYKVNMATEITPLAKLLQQHFGKGVGGESEALTISALTKVKDSH